MIKNVIRQFRNNPLTNATFHLSPNGQVIWKGVVAIKRSGWSDPILFSHQNISGVTAQPGSVDIENGNLIWKRGKLPNVVISGFDLKRVADATLDWNWDIFRAPDSRDVRRRSLLE